MLLTISSLLILLTLVYSTLSQMRPTRVIFAIETRALNARERELELVCRTRRIPRLSGPPQLVGLSPMSGYVTGVDAGLVTTTLAGLDDVEVELLVSLGQHVVVGEPLVHVRGAGDSAQRVSTIFCQQVLELGQQRNVQVDPLASVEALASIGWTSGSSAKHSPEVAGQSLNALRDLLCRWTAEPEDHREALAVSYRGRTTERLNALWTACLACSRYPTSRNSSRPQRGCSTPWHCRSPGWPRPTAGAWLRPCRTARRSSPPGPGRRCCEPPPSARRLFC